MKNKISELAKYRMLRARETFNDGMKLLEGEALNSAVNRFYYAAFYAAPSLLATKDLDSSKHSGVISLFNKHFVKTGEVDHNKAKFLKKSFEKRQDTDYEDFVKVSRKEVEELKNGVIEFINECEKLLEKILNKKG